MKKPQEHTREKKSKIESSSWCTTAPKLPINQRLNGSSVMAWFHYLLWSYQKPCHEPTMRAHPRGACPGYSVACYVVLFMGKGRRGRDIFICTSRFRRNLLCLLGHNITCSQIIDVGLSWWQCASHPFSHSFCALPPLLMVLKQELGKSALDIA